MKHRPQDMRTPFPSPSLFSLPFPFLSSVPFFLFRSLLSLPFPFGYSVPFSLFRSLFYSISFPRFPSHFFDPYLISLPISHPIPITVASPAPPRTHAGADPNAPDPATNATPLMTAARGGFLDLCKLLITAGADVNRVDRSKQSALHRAAAKADNKAVVELLLTKGKADPTLVDSNGLTPAQVAAKVDDKSAVALMLSKAEAAAMKKKEAEQKKAEEAERKAQEEAEKQRRKDEAKLSKSKRKERSISLAPGQAAHADVSKADRWMSMIYASEENLAESPKSTGSASDSPTGTPPIQTRSLLRRLSRTTSDPAIIRPPGAKPPLQLPANVARFTPDPVVNEVRVLTPKGSTNDLSEVGTAAPAASSGSAGSSPSSAAAPKLNMPPKRPSSANLSSSAPSSAPKAPESSTPAGGRPSPPPPPKSASAGDSPEPPATPVTRTDAASTAAALTAAHSAPPPPKSAAPAAAAAAPARNNFAALAPANVSKGQLGRAESADSPNVAKRPSPKDMRKALAGAVSESAADADADGELPLSREDMMRMRRESLSSTGNSTPSLMDIMKRFNGEEEMT